MAASDEGPLTEVDRRACRAFLPRQGPGIAEGATGAVLTRAQLEALYGAPVDVVTDTRSGISALLPG